jgi:hypothetical protein
MESRAQQLELIQRLLLEAGRIMEDISPELALKLPESAADVGKRIEQLSRNASVLSILAMAADGLLEPLVDRR